MVLNHTSRLRESLRHKERDTRWLRTARFRLPDCAMALLAQLAQLRYARRTLPLRLSNS